MSVWLAQSSVDRARQRLETRVRDVARNLSEETSFPLTSNVLKQVKTLSGADFLLIPGHGAAPVSTLDQPPEALPDVPVVTDWQLLRLGPPVPARTTRIISVAGFAWYVLPVPARCSISSIPKTFGATPGGKR